MVILCQCQHNIALLQTFGGSEIPNKLIMSFTIMQETISLNLK